MASGNLEVTCKLGIVPMNSFSLNIHDFISCRLPFQEPPNIYLSSSIQLHLAQWKQMEEPEVSVKAAFECISSPCFEVLGIRLSAPALCHRVAAGVTATYETQNQHPVPQSFPGAMCTRFYGQTLYLKRYSNSRSMRINLKLSFLIYIFYVMQIPCHWL